MPVVSSEEWPLVSVVVTGYERPEQLALTVESLLAVTRYPSLELILADDGSSEQARQKMRELPFDRFVFAARNRGLGANTNAGLAAARGDYVLQLQDDWQCLGPPDFLERGVRLMQTRPSVGLVRFTKLFSPDRALPPHEVLASDPDVLIIKPERGSRFFVYSDQPHLKSRSYVEFIGPYQESRYMQRTEEDMRRRFNEQTRFEAAFIEGYSAFRHVGRETSHRRPLPTARVVAVLHRVPYLATLLRRLRKRFGA
jgi:glycosyltransferase involved in cell wall biosynthesis